jgi:hypothetical protein
MAQSQFETDSEGNIILKPVVGWTLTDVDAMNVLLQVRYEDGPEDIGTSGTAIQFVLTPQTCLRFAAELTKQANLILHDKLPPGKVPN